MSTAISLTGTYVMYYAAIESHISGRIIVEDAKYEELIALNGFFAELVAKQQLDYEK